MINKSIVFVCFAILLLVPSVAMPQTPKQQKSLFDTYVRQGSRPFYEVAESASSVVVAETPKGETAKEETKAGSPDGSKPAAASDGSAAKPAVEEEIEALKARLADLEKRAGAPGRAARTARLPCPRD